MGKKKEIESIRSAAKEIQLSEPGKVETVYFHGYSMAAFLIGGG